MSGTASGFIMPPSCTSTARSASKPRGPQGRRPLRPARGLGVVSDQYVPVQNRQAFGFLDAVVADGGLRYHTAGTLGKGEKIFLLAKLPESIRVKNSDDLVDKYLLLSSAHDGSAAPRVFFTPIRVVCQNTLSMAERRGRGQGPASCTRAIWKPRSWRPSKSSVWPGDFFDDAAAVIDRLASHSPTSAQLAAYFGELYLDPQEGKENTRAVNTRSNLQRLFEEGVGHDQPGVKGTTWAAYNAVTEYVDHVRTARGRDDCDRTSRRLDSIWFGSGARLKAKSTGGVAATKHRGNPSRRRRTSATAPAGKRPPRLSEGSPPSASCGACWPNPRCGRTSTVPAAGARHRPRGAPPGQRPSRRGSADGGPDAPVGPWDFP